MMSMTPYRAPRIKALDAIRGAAVLLVMLRHAWPNTFPGAGLVGVVLFFVLSGFLITGVLDRDLATFGRIRYVRFYVHRAYRLLPALLLFLAVFAIVEATTNLLGGRSEGSILPSIAAGLLYIKDLPLPFRVSDAIAPLWTLALEEQFYLLWPGALALATARGKRNLLFALSAVGLYLACVASVWVFLIRWPDKLNHVYSLPTTWGLALVAGGALYYYKEHLHRFSLDKVIGRVSFALSGGTLLLICLYAEVQWSAMFYVVGSLITIVTSMVVIGLAAGGAGGKSSPLLRPLRWLGAVSYAAYLWNYMIVEWLKAILGRQLDPLAGLLSMVGTVIAATVSWWTVEALGRQWRRRYDNRRKAVPAAASAR